MGEDTSDNIALFLGPRWSDPMGEVMPTYDNLRGSVLMAGIDV